MILLIYVISTTVHKQLLFLIYAQILQSFTGVGSGEIVVFNISWWLLAGLDLTLIESFVVSLE